MRHFRTDLVPLLAIIAGGAVGASLSFTFLALSPSGDVPAPVPVVAPSATAESVIAGVRVEVYVDGDGIVLAGPLSGKVREAEANRASAMDWTHPQFRASAMTVDGSVYGLVQASPGRFREADRLLLDGVPFHQELEPGVALVTSGLGGAIPAGSRLAW